MTSINHKMIIPGDPNRLNNNCVSGYENVYR